MFWQEYGIDVKIQKLDLIDFQKQFAYVIY